MSQTGKFGITYLTEKTGCDAVDEELAIQKALGETLRRFGVKFVIVPGDMMGKDYSDALDEAAKTL